MTIMPVTEDQCVAYFPIDTHEIDLDQLLWVIERQKAAALVAVRFGCPMQTEWVDNYRDLAIGIEPRLLTGFLEALPREFRPASVNYTPSNRYPDKYFAEIASRISMDGEILAA